MTQPSAQVYYCATQSSYWSFLEQMPRKMHVKIPYMVYNSTDPFKYLLSNGVTDKFGLSVCYNFENPVVSSSDKSKIHRA